MPRWKNPLPNALKGSDENALKKIFESIQRKLDEFDGVHQRSNTDVATNINAAAWQAVPNWDTAVHDTDYEWAWAVGTPSRITARYSGRARFYTSIHMESAVTAASVLVAIRKNGATFLFGVGGGHVTSAASTQDETVAQIEAWDFAVSSDDYYEVVTLQEGAAGSVVMKAYDCVFTAERKGLGGE